jgi:two-component system sensor histidine kinase VicK
MFFLFNVVQFIEFCLIIIILDDNEVIVKVEDTGQSIDPTVLPRLSSKFVSKSFEGTGLGLYISNNILEAHSGRMWADNSTDGKGATFSFSLPISN